MSVNKKPKKKIVQMHSYFVRQADGTFRRTGTRKEGQIDDWFGQMMLQFYRKDYFPKRAAHRLSAIYGYPVDEGIVAGLFALIRKLDEEK